MIINEDTLIKEITDYLSECDASEFSNIVSFVFGGVCEPHILTDNMEMLYKYDSKGQVVPFIHVDVREIE